LGTGGLLSVQHPKEQKSGSLERDEENEVRSLEKTKG
jgi:hypothetical protein